MARRFLKERGEGSPNPFPNPPKVASSPEALPWGDSEATGKEGHGRLSMLDGFGRKRPRLRCGTAAPPPPQSHLFPRVGATHVSPQQSLSDDFCRPKSSFRGEFVATVWDAEIRAPMISAVQPRCKRSLFDLHRAKSAPREGAQSEGHRDTCAKRLLRGAGGEVGGGSSAQTPTLSLSDRARSTSLRSMGTSLLLTLLGVSKGP